MEYAIYLWSVLAAIILAILLYLIIGCLHNGDGNSETTTPSLFESISFMRSEDVVLEAAPRRRASTASLQQSRKRRSNSDLSKKKSSRHVTHVQLKCQQTANVFQKYVNKQLSYVLINNVNKELHFICSKNVNKRLSYLLIRNVQNTM